MIAHLDARHLGPNCGADPRELVARHAGVLLHAEGLEVPRRSVQVRMTYSAVLHIEENVRVPEWPPLHGHGLEIALLVRAPHAQRLDRERHRCVLCFSLTGII